MQKSLSFAALSALWLAISSPVTVNAHTADDQRAHNHQHAHQHDQHAKEKHAEHAHKHDSHDHKHHHDHKHGDEFTQLGAHVHGAATLTLVLEGNELQLALQSAAYNIVGFEHAPSTTEQKQEIALALDNLAKGNWFSVNPEANCEIQSADASTDLTEPGHVNHGDFYANISLLCQRPALMQQLELSLFSLTPALEKIDVQWVLNGQQGAATTTLSNSAVRF
ncbi:ZrgA family zinc uptake protein [Alishewanella sp. d11]|uniref:ZrgA family zinc uptake protein n=1 Tax=Alishewanella sp. d11 TaxID=3414030 RepID=UPI003BF793A4